ncbi:MAG: RluA family pseudouridine synthase [Candidatus Saccharimonadales bacterium]
MPIFSVRVSEELVGKRTDKLLADLLPQFPRAALAKLFDMELVWLNDKVTKPGIKVRPNDRIKADLSPLDIKIEDIDLPIIYQDDDVLVVDKPNGIISHARGRYFDEPSVASFVRQITHQDGERAGIVHRLDRATSGVMVCAKNVPALSWLQRQFSARKVLKTYMAVISGSMPTGDGVIDMPVARNPAKPQQFHVSEAGKHALTRYKTVAADGKHSLLELTPETGRTHQLRVHLKELNHPIVGDELYGGEPAGQLMLHAAKLEITLPNHEHMVFTSALPEAFGKYPHA